MWCKHIYQALKLLQGMLFKGRADPEGHGWLDIQYVVQVDLKGSSKKILIGLFRLSHSQEPSPVPFLVPFLGKEPSLVPFSVLFSSKEPSSVYFTVYF